MLLVGGAQEQGRRVHRAAGDNYEGRVDAESLAVALYLDGSDLAAGRVRQEPSRVRVCPERHISLPHRWTDAADIRLALGEAEARERVEADTATMSW